MSYLTRQYGKNTRTDSTDYAHLFKRWAKKAEDLKEVSALKEAEWAKKLAEMPVEIVSGESIYRREGDEILQSWRGDEFETIYHLRRNEDVFDNSLVKYLRGN